MGRPRSKNPSYKAVMMRAVRERKKCGIVRLWLEVDQATLEEKLKKNFPDKGLLTLYMNQFIDDRICDSARIIQDIDDN